MEKATRSNYQMQIIEIIQSSLVASYIDLLSYHEQQNVEHVISSIMTYICVNIYQPQSKEGEGDPLNNDSECVKP